MNCESTEFSCPWPFNIEVNSCLINLVLNITTLIIKTIIISIIIISFHTDISMTFPNVQWQQAIPFKAQAFPDFVQQNSSLHGLAAGSSSVVRAIRVGVIQEIGDEAAAPRKFFDHALYFLSVRICLSHA